MGAYLPKAVRSSEASEYLEVQGLTLLGQGKTRDLYEVPEPMGGGMLIVASDRISIFDFVLPALIPRKGEVLTALTHFWLTKILAGFPSHLKEARGTVDNAAFELMESFLSELPIERCLVVNRVEIPPFEMIFRHHLGGSVYKKYLETGVVAGQQLPPGLPKWSMLDQPLFTPSTKAESGHDVNITEAEYLEVMGEDGRKSIEMFRLAYATAYQYAARRGILILDTKFEGKDIIADEVLTPDSSRYAKIDDVAAAIAEGREPTFFDKQVVRDYGALLDTPKGKGLKSLDPTDPADLAWVEDNVRLPEDLIQETSERYLALFRMVTGSTTLDHYQFDELGCV